MIGRIHSIETLGTLDGPGIRTVVFMQGCPLRCKYCHNPDALAFDEGTEYTAEALVAFIKRYKPYYGDNGGVTFSGGEALMQGEFLLEAMTLLKEENIHIAIDTSGIGQSNYYEEILELADLILLDIKHFDDQAFKDLTNVSIKRTQAFIKVLRAFKGQLWIRHVMVPGYTDNYSSMDRLYKYIVYYISTINRIEILPYHKMGVQKYLSYGLKDPLAEIPEMDPNKAKMYEDYINSLFTSKIHVV